MGTGRVGEHGRGWEAWRKEGAVGLPESSANKGSYSATFAAPSRLFPGSECSFPTLKPTLYRGIQKPGCGQ